MTAGSLYLVLLLLDLCALTVILLGYHHNPHEETWSQIRKGRHRVNYTVLFAIAIVVIYALGWFLQHVS